MRRLLAITAVLGLGLVLVLTSTNEAAAKSSKGSGSKGSGSMHAHNHQHHNHQHNHRYHTHHRGYRNWSSWYWNSRFSCYYYWCPSERCYYYWYSPGSCYYPVSSIDDYPPPATQYQAAAHGVAPLPLQIQVTNINQNGQNGPLPVSGPVPPPGR
jgi:hypothetical protein